MSAIQSVITILKFDEYNPRKDRKRHHWFRVDNDIAFSPSLEGLDADQKWLWMCLVSWTSKRQGEPVDYNVKYFVKHAGLNEKKIKDAITHFQRQGMIRLVTSRLPVGAEPDTERCSTYNTDNTIQTDNTDNTFDFELAAGEFKKQFPATVKGSKAESRFKEQMKDQDDFSNLLKAITNYASHLSAPENKWRHSKQSFESFLGTKSSGFFWHSWIDMTAPKTNGMYDFLNDTKEGA